MRRKPTKLRPCSDQGGRAVAPTFALLLKMLFFAVLTSCLPLSALPKAAPGFDQSPPRKPPALIRDTGVAEGKEDPDAAKEKLYNPMMAEKSVQIGDFYFKKKNYDAAIQRYKEALEYQPNRIEAFEALGRAYEKKGEIASALALYKDFIGKYPSSPKVTEFRSKIAKLQKK